MVYNVLTNGRGKSKSEEMLKLVFKGQEQVSYLRREKKRQTTLKRIVLIITEIRFDKFNLEFITINSEKRFKLGPVVIKLSGRI